MSVTLEQVEAKYVRPKYAGRPAAASTATGLMSKHIAERDSFIEAALGDSDKCTTVETA